MSETESVTFNLELNVEQPFNNVRRLETAFYRVLSLIRRLGLPENIDNAIMKVQKLTMVVRLLHSSINALTYSTPYGFLMSLISIVGTSLTVGEMTSEYMGELQGR
jgi:hypothetical protein